jgi:hypothetical protein
LGFNSLIFFHFLNLPYFQILNNILIAEAYYCTSNGKVRGVLTLTDTLLMFDPSKCIKNQKFVRNKFSYKSFRLKNSRDTKLSLTSRMFLQYKRSEPRMKVANTKQKLMSNNFTSTTTTYS